MRSIRRPSAPLVVSIIALFAALGGTSYAAVKITGKDIAKKTITYKNIKDETLGPKKIKPDSLTGDRIDEATLGTVPNADHATAADTATNATKAADADKLDGLDSSALMLSKPRAYEVNQGAVNNFGSGAPLATLTDLPGGTYVVMAKLTYDNDGGVAESESCTLEVPGANDETEFVVENTETLSLMEVTTSASSFSPYVHCTSDANDDTFGVLTIIANRVD